MAGICKLCTALINCISGSIVNTYNKHRRMTALYCDPRVDASTARRVDKDCTSQSTRNNHGHACGTPITITETQHQARVDEIIRANLSGKQKDMAVILGISNERVCHFIIYEILGYSNVCARWVPRRFTSEMKQRLEAVSRTSGAIWIGWGCFYPPNCHCQWVTGISLWPSKQAQFYGV